MADQKPLPVAGYKPQSDESIKLANEGKQLEERYLRWLEKCGGHNAPEGSPVCDPRFLALAKTHIQTGAMWAVRSIFQPGRVSLPEDESLG